MAKVKIVGINTNNPDYSSGIATQLQVIGVNDDYDVECYFQWFLMDDNGSILDASVSQSDKERPHIYCSGTDYQNWYGGNAFPCQYVASKKGFQII